MDRMNLEYQRAVSDFVSREVHYCVSHLVSELAQNEAYMDELMEVCAMPDHENEDEWIEAYEHWIVSDWLADKLAERGEMVLKDFLGLTIWGRATTGQAISLDEVICDIWDSING